VSVRGFQRALCDLIASPELCVRLRAAADGTLDGYELTGLERRRLEAVVRQPGMSVNCTLYRSNRVTPLYSMLPRSCALLGESLSDEVSAYWAAEPTDMQFGPEVEGFAEFLRARVGSGELRSPYLLEMLDFELAIGALRFAPRRRLLAELAERQPGDAWEVNPLLRVARFEHDPGALLEALAHGRRPPDGLASGDFYLVLDASAAELAIRPIGARLGALLAGVAAGATIAGTDTPELQALVDAGVLVPA
jgi:hypothetical protein